VAPFCDVGVGAAVTRDVLLVLAAVTDPGNAGTLVRSAEASEVGAVLFCDGSVDPFNPKVVRASAGSLFRVPVVRGGDPVEVLERIGAGGHHRVGAVPRAGIAHTAADLGGRLAIVLGSESQGLPAGIGDLVDQQISIPMAGRGDSLNVAMAGTLICFEAMRQRRLRRPETAPSS
jgi:TrmH family RNA methyltransferase